MKTRINLMLCAITLAITSLVFTAFTYGNQDVKTQILENCDSFVYSWSPAFGAVKYYLELESTTTQQSYDYETISTSVTDQNLPCNDTYDLILHGVKADESTFIIVEDVIIR